MRSSTIKQVQSQIGMPQTVQASFQGAAQAFRARPAARPSCCWSALIVVYIVLGILYESFVHPLTILSGLPSAAVGALFTLYLFHLCSWHGIFEDRLDAQPLCLRRHDHADRHREEERDHDDRLRAVRGSAARTCRPKTAIFEAAIIRFRPIMMTTMAALMGTLPIAIGFGAGGETRRPLGLAVVGGLVLSQLLTLYITPVLYVYLDNLGDALRRKRGVAPHTRPAE